MPESSMLRFVQLLPQVSPKGDFLLKDLPGSGRRIDILCRELAACFSWGPKSWPKSDLEIIALIANTKILTFRDPQIQIPSGEVGWASVIRESLKDKPPDYVDVSEGTLEEIIKRLNQARDSKLWVLDELGTNLLDNGTIRRVTHNSFMLGNHQGFDSQSKSIIAQYDIQRLSLGKKSYLSSHCLAAIISAFEGMVR